MHTYLKLGTTFLCAPFAGVLLQQQFDRPSFRFPETDSAVIYRAHSTIPDPCRFGAWSVSQFVDYPPDSDNRGFDSVSGADAAAKVDEVKKLLDTNACRHVLEHYQDGLSPKLSQLSEAMAVVYLEETDLYPHRWRSAHKQSLFAARELLESLTHASSRSTDIDTRTLIACLALAKIETGTTRQDLEAKVASKAVGKDAFLGLTATVMMCRDAVQDGELVKAKKLATIGLAKYKDLSTWFNLTILKFVQQDPAKAFEVFRPLG